jgi:hypothetical protein
MVTRMGVRILPVLFSIASTSAVTEPTLVRRVGRAGARFRDARRDRDEDAWRLSAVSPPTLDAVKDALGLYGLTFPVIETMVPDQEMAMRVGFLGSPTVRINGLDIEPSARQRTTFGMMCRTYESSGGVPSEDLIRSAIAEAAHRDVRTGEW